MEEKIVAIVHPKILRDMERLELCTKGFMASEKLKIIITEKHRACPWCGVVMKESEYLEHIIDCEVRKDSSK